MKIRDRQQNSLNATPSQAKQCGLLFQCNKPKQKIAELAVFWGIERLDIFDKTLAKGKIFANDEFDTANGKKTIARNPRKK